MGSQQYSITITYITTHNIIFNATKYNILNYTQQEENRTRKKENNKR